MLSFPFTAAALTADDPADIIDNTMTGRTFRAAITDGVLWSVGAHDIANVPGRHQLGGLAFHARILPMTKTGRSQSPRRMGVLVSLTPADEIDVEVNHDGRDNSEHACIRGIYIDQLRGVRNELVTGVV